jgi:hypothetical protein
VRTTLLALLLVLAPAACADEFVGYGDGEGGYNFGYGHAHGHLDPHTQAYSAVEPYDPKVPDPYDWGRPGYRGYARMHGADAYGFDRGHEPEGWQNWSRRTRRIEGRIPWRVPSDCPPPGDPFGDREFDRHRWRADFP